MKNQYFHNFSDVFMFFKETFYEFDELFLKIFAFYENLMLF